MKKIISSKLKPWVLLYSSTFFIVAMVFFITNNRSNFFTLITFSVLIIICFYFLFQVFKRIEIINHEIILHFPLRLFFRRKKVKLTKIKLVYLKIDGLLEFSFPTLTLVTKQFPFIIDLPINDMNDVTDIIYQIKQQSKPKIKGKKVRLVELEKRLNSKILDINDF